MTDYSGSSNFEFNIERLKDLRTGELFPISSMPLYDEFRYECVDITLKVQGRSYFVAGKYFGPPENCYPDDGDTEIESVVNSAGTDCYNILSQDEIDSITQLIDEKVSSEEPPCNEDFDDDDDNDDYRYD